MRNVLIDAGPLVVLFAEDDAHHAKNEALVDETGNAASCARY